MLSLKQFSGLLSLSVASLISGSVFAAQPGLYVGGQMGYGYVHDSGISDGEMSALVGEALGYGNFTTTTFNGQFSENGFAWRVYGGYQIGFNWAMEIGWSHFPRVPVDASQTGLDLNTGLPYVATTSGTFQTNAFDGVGKYIFYIPRMCQLSIYGKLGLAYVVGRSNESVSVSEDSPVNGVLVTADDQSITDRVYPTFGFGVNYDFRPDISMDLSYTRIQKVGTSDQLGSIDTVLLGMSLHFG